MAAQITVRPATDDDDLDALNAGSLSWIGQGLLRAMFAASAGDVPTALLVAEVDGEPAGFASAVGHGFGDGRRGLANVYVLPGHRGKGAGRALWRAVLEICTPERVPGVISQLVDADTATIDLLAVHGWQIKGLHHESELDLSAIDHLGGLRHPADAGVRLAPLSDDTDELGWRAFGQVFDRLMRDAPDVAEGAEDMPYAVMRAVIAEPWQVMGAWVGDKLVGLTAIAVRDPARGRLNTWFTGVDRAHRGRGLATALKTAQAFAVRDAGWRTIVTQNMEGNDAILAANDRLGFERGIGLRDVSYDFKQ